MVELLEAGRFRKTADDLQGPPLPSLKRVHEVDRRRHPRVPWTASVAGREKGGALLPGVSLEGGRDSAWSQWLVVRTMMSASGPRARRKRENPTLRVFLRSLASAVIGR
jgi:hypothetical protein